MSAVSAENLSKIYTGGNKAVDGISFNLEQGEIFGFLGPNGYGKLAQPQELKKINPCDLFLFCCPIDFY